jgi:hypothetical protein
MRWRVQAQQSSPGTGPSVPFPASSSGLPQREDLHAAPAPASRWLDEGGRQEVLAAHRYRLRPPGGVRRLQYF